MRKDRNVLSKTDRKMKLNVKYAALSKYIAINQATRCYFVINSTYACCLVMYEHAFYFVDLFVKNSSLLTFRNIVKLLRFALVSFHTPR